MSDGEFAAKLALLKDFVPRLPTEEENKIWAENWLRWGKPFYLENWPPAIRALSIDTWPVTLSADDARLLYAGLDAKWSQKDPVGLEAIEHRLDSAIHKIGGRAFIRLGSRSPKDSFMVDETGRLPPCTSGAMALDLLFSGKDRMIEDLKAMSYTGYGGIIAVRRWMEFTNDREFRVFVEDGKIAGITQYHFTTAYPHLQAIREALEAKIRYYVEHLVIPCAITTWQSFTIDLVFLGQGWQPMVVEINPAWSMGQTDPCLFRGDQHLDGSFRLASL